MKLNAKTILLACILMLTSCSAGRSSVQVDHGVPFSDYLTPLMFGAKGDGKHDDTEALRKALYESNKQSKVLYFPSGYNFKVTGTLNYYNKEYQSYTLNMMGCLPIKKGAHSVNDWGGISVSEGVSLFKSAMLMGSIDRICIVGKIDLTTRVFDHCECNGLIIEGCNISHFGTVFFDTSVRTLCQITHSKFLSVLYFSKNENTSSGFIDSTISFCYINGGQRSDDNSCFEWAYYNGSIISNNFIDYYRTIYSPKATRSQPFVGPLSYSNQYEVFRYFYAAGSNNLKSFTFSSIADAFHMNDPDKVQHRYKYKALTYTGKDGKTYDMPPYVAVCHSAWNISIKDAKIERNMGPLVFIFSALTEYEYNRFEVSFVGNNQYKKGQINLKEGDAKPFYNKGKYGNNGVKIEGIVEELDDLPDFSMGWTSSFNGRVVQVKGKRYRAVNVYDGKKWKAEWKKEY